MSKKSLTKPTLFLLYGFPGAGKSFFGRQFCSEVNAAYISGDQLRYEFFEDPQYTKDEDQIIEHISLYMTDQFLQSGLSVVYDTESYRTSQRRILRELALKSKAEIITVWFQLDIETAFTRVVKRDRRKTDDKYSIVLDRSTFESIVSKMQNPVRYEDYVVVSGKHTFSSQRSAVLKKLKEKGILSQDGNANLIKPELVNLVPKQLGGRVDNSRRNIVIR
jgi:predicted kinase